MTTNEESDLKFIARQLVKLNESVAALSENVKVLPELTERVTRAEAHLKMLNGWTEGQEAISLNHTRRLQDIQTMVNRAVGDTSRMAGQIETLATHVETAERVIEGLSKLAQDTFDIASDVKKAILPEESHSARDGEHGKALAGG